ncbi:serum response factor-binding protein 1 isoform X2 [Pelobates fuscus]
MRKDVKKIKVLTIRKLTRNIAKLKSKKGTEELLLKNQRRAQRLLEEIHAIKELKPDDVTKTALQKEISFDNVCKKPNSTAETRAIARLATHPLLKHKIAALKEAIKAFKDARRHLPEGETVKKQDHNLPESDQNEGSNVEVKSNQGKAKPKRKAEETKQVETKQVETKQVETKQVETKQVETKQVETKQVEAKQVDAKRVEAKRVDAKRVDAKKVDANQEEKKTDTLNEQECKRIFAEPDYTTENALNNSESLPAQENMTVQTIQTNTEVKSAAVERIPEAVKSISDKKVLAQSSSRDSSDIDDSDKEYFDDSTEERFCKHSSGFEDSDSDSEDDFFIGKVRQTKRKKSDKICSEGTEKKKPSSKPATKDSDMKHGITAPKPVKIQSLFCKSLSDTKQKTSFKKRETNFPPAKDRKTIVPPSNKLIWQSQPSRGPAMKPKSKPQESQQSLHPSWEASRRRKEQQSQITAFQGKKIIFDD